MAKIMVPESYNPYFKRFQKFERPGWKIIVKPMDEENSNKFSVGVKQWRCYGLWTPIDRFEIEEMSDEDLEQLIDILIRHSEFVAEGTTPPSKTITKREGGGWDVWEKC